MDAADLPKGCRLDITCGALAAVLLGLVVLVGLGLDPDGSRLGINLFPAHAARITRRLPGIAMVRHAVVGSHAAARKLRQSCCEPLSDGHGTARTCCLVAVNRSPLALAWLKVCRVIVAVLACAPAERVLQPAS